MQMTSSLIQASLLIPRNMLPLQQESNRGRKVINFKIRSSHKHTLRSSLVEAKSDRYPQQTARHIYSIPCECGRSCIGETDRPLAVQPHEHRQHTEEAFQGKSKLAQPGYEKCHRVGWNETRILEI
jgi:hypothetical protein